MAFKLDRIAQQTLIRGEMMPVLRALTALESDRAPLGFAGGEDSWDYPLFGEHLQRRVVRLDPARVTYGLLDRDKLAGVVFFNVGRPPSSLKTITLGPDYYLVPSRTHGEARSLAQVLVRLHVEPHREQRELAARDEQQRDQHDRRRPGSPLPMMPQHRLGDAEREADDGHHDPERVEEDERVEVADDVLLAHPPEEALEQQPRDARHDLADA